jgi:hypothetical protein
MRYKFDVFLAVRMNIAQMHRRTLFLLALSIAKLAYSQIIADTLSYETTPNVISRLATPNLSGPKKFRFSRNLECGNDQDGCSGSTILGRLPQTFLPLGS